MELGHTLAVERRKVFNMGINVRGVISLSTDWPVKRIAFILVCLWPINVYCVIVSETKVKGENASTVAVG